MNIIEHFRLFNQYITLTFSTIFTDQKRKEAVAAANDLTQALVDHLNVG